MPRPLLTVGIPTYNRLATLPRAVDSALAQDCGDLEVLIADNASTDGTEGYCRAIAEQEQAVRYVRHPINRGPTANFNFILRHARGDYFLFLSDDDWLDPSYGSCCLRWLRAHPDYAIVSGRPRYLRNDGATADGRPIDLPHTAAARRVHAYLRDVDDGAAIYGVLPRAILDRVSDIRNVTGNDWLFVAEIAALGKVRTLPDVHLHRSLKGTSASYRSLTATLEVPAIQAVLPFVTVWTAFLADVLWRSSVHREAMPRSERALLAVLCGATMARRQMWVWTLSLSRWPLTRPPYLLVKRLYRLLERRANGRLTLRFPGHSTVTNTPGRMACPTQSQDRPPVVAPPVRPSPSCSAPDKRR